MFLKINMEISYPFESLYFAWRLPTNVKIATVNKEMSQVCPRCESADETSIHTMHNYQKAWDVLICGSIDGPTHNYVFP